MVKLGIIGLGHMGGYHFSAASSIVGAQIVAISDPLEANWAKATSTKVIKSHSYTEWLGQVDGVIIATPTKFHYEIAKYCLSRGKHVLIEKPITKNLEQAKELFEIAKKNKLTLHVGHVERFNGAVQELSNVVKDPYLIECHRIGPFTARPKEDSVILDLMIHDLDIILNLVNSDVKTVNCIGSKITTDMGDIADVQIKFENGVLANLISSRVSQIKKRTMAIHQKEAFIQLDFTTQDIHIHKSVTDSVKVNQKEKELTYKQEGSVERLFVYKENPLKLEIENFIKSVKTGTKRINPQQDIKALALALDLEKILINS